MSVLAAAVLQTIAYTGYKLFYNAFGVRPEEVGYDYASLFPRTAIPLAVLLSFVLTALATVSFAVALYGGMGYSFIKSLRTETPEDPFHRERQARLVMIGFATTFGVLLVMNALGASSVAIWAVVAVFLITVLIEHRVARDTASRSWLDVLFAPRIYRSPRRLLLIAFAISVPTWDPNVEITFSYVLSMTLLVFLADRIVPVMPTERDETYTGGGTSPWLRRTALLGVAGLIGAFLLVGFVVGLPAMGLADRVRDVRLGQALVYKYDNPLRLAALLAEPRADRVRVQWLGSDPPPMFRDDRGRRRAVPLTYFGSNNGISVFFSPPAVAWGLGDVYRWPTAAIGVESVDPRGQLPS